MKKRKKKILKYSKERAILSDVLPYETPITFSNRHLYNFLTLNKVNLNGDFISWEKSKNDSTNIVNEQFIRVLFGLKGPINNNTIKIDPKKEKRKIPFGYRITHKERDFRELSIPHPKTQLELVAFYEKYKELILYYSNISPFSIRKPHGVAKFIFKNDRLHKKNKGDNDDIIESHEKEYENLKTFFTYKKYSNIYQFYEDYRYHRAEKKYNKMFKFDIAKCFDSIYTHSLSWAIFNKEIVKDNLNKKPFSDDFDCFMQNSNYGETNGILIGPEFSRIFAELILQQIDKSIEIELRNGENKLYFKKDYEIYRYVDDFFVFYNTDETRDKILSLYKMKLKDYKMSISESKTIFYEKPLITDLTIGKGRVVELFDEKIKLKIEKPEDENEIFHKLSYDCNSNKLIIKFKTIIKESNVQYKDIMNFTFAIIGKRLERCINKFEKYYSTLCELEKDSQLNEEEIKKKNKQESVFSNFIVEYLDFLFFLYSVSPKVNSTIRISNILALVIKYFNGKYRYKIVAPFLTHSYYLFDRFQNSSTSKEFVLKKIADEINLVISSSKMEKHIQIENLYLLILLRELGKKFTLTENELIKYFKLEESNEKLALSFTPNYFTITVLLFYIRDIKSFSRIKSMLKDEIINKIKLVDLPKRNQTTENVLLFFDVLSCPYLDNKFKREVFTLFNIDIIYHNQILMYKKSKKYWFTKWDNFNLAKELTAKKSLEVYS
ncbi:antiviral reverse transcriptase Drt3b [Flavobacterium panici]|uniref:antiviral reverse transcriptase Drt3b n=1 Tax=Flavobacterium panici TaxID=2654843 RepID=UPI0036106112